MSETRVGCYLHLLHAKLQGSSSHLLSLQTKGNSPFFPPCQLHLQIKIIKGIQQREEYDSAAGKGYSGLLEFYRGAQEVLPAGDHVSEGRFRIDKVAIQQNSRHVPEYIRGRVSEVDG